MSNKLRTDFFSGQLVLTEDMLHDQQGRMQADQTLMTDMWRDGIFRDPNGLSNFTIAVDGTTTSLINIGWGIGYSNGHRISIDANKDYNANAPFATTNGVCTPASSGNRGVPIASYVAGQSNFVWAQYLEQNRTNPTAVDLVVGDRHFPHVDDGYRIVINTTNPPGNLLGLTNAVYLGTVFGQGVGTALAASPVGICQTQITLSTLIPKDSLVTANYQNVSITPQKLKTAGEMFIFDGACFSTLIASCQANVSVQPFLPTGIASKRFSQYGSFGIATSKTVFRPSFDGNFNIINISLEGDVIGTITPQYDGLCNIVRIVEVVDSRTVSHDVTYKSQDGTSMILALTEGGI